MDIKTFFKKVLGTLEQEVKTEVNRAKNTAQQQVRSTVSQATQPSQPTQQASQQQRPVSEPQVVNRTEAQWVAYFREILATDFSQFSVRENVPVQEMAGDVADEFQLYYTRPRQVYRAEWGKPYTFVLYEVGNPKGVVMLGGKSSHYRNVKYLIARMYAKKMGLPYINFLTNMPNERSYVVARIRKMMNK